LLLILSDWLNGIIVGIINGGISNQNSNNKVSELESTCVTSNVSSSRKSLGITCVTSDVSSSSDYLGITYTLRRLNLPRKIGLVYSTKVSKKGFGLTSEGNPSTRIGSSDSSNISKVIPMLVCLLFAINLAFFYSICSRLSTRPISLAYCDVKVW